MGKHLLRYGLHGRWAVLLLVVSTAIHAQAPPPSPLALKATGTTLLGFGAFRVALSQDGTILASSGMDEPSIVLRQMPSGKQIRKVTGPENEIIESLEFSTNGQVLEARAVNSAQAENSRTIRLWEVGTAKELFKQTIPLLGAVAFSADRKTAAVSTGDHTVTLVDTVTKKQLRQHRWKEQKVIGLGFSADGKLWATTYATNKEGRSTAQLWDTGAETVVLESPFALAGPVSPDGKRLAAWTGLGPCLGGALVLWDFKIRKGLALAAGQMQTTGSVTFSHDNKWLVGVWAPVGEGGRKPVAVAELWAMPSARRIFTVTLPGGVNAASFSADGKALLLASDKHCLLQQLAPLRDLVRSVALLTFSPDGRLLATGGIDGVVQLWDVGTGKPLHRLKGHAKPVQAVAFSPDGGLLCSASADGTIGLWTVRTGRLRQRLKLQLKDWPFREWSLNQQVTIKTAPELVRGLSFSQDGKIMTASTPIGLRRWNVDTGKELHP